MNKLNFNTTTHQVIISNIAEEFLQEWNFDLIQLLLNIVEYQIIETLENTRAEDMNQNERSMILKFLQKDFYKEYTVLLVLELHYFIYCTSSILNIYYPSQLSRTRKM